MPNTKTQAMPSHPPSSLLFLGDYYGTLAAARCLGEQGILVQLADEHRFVRAGASKHVSAFHRTPPLADASSFMQWLVEEGPRFHGAVLHPASDELAFLFARYRDKLAEHYSLCLPTLDTMYRILNKERLHEACEKVGCAVPRTWCPKGEDELRAILREVEGDESGRRRVVMLKPKTQVQLRTGMKGAEIPESADLVTSFRAFRDHNPYGDELIAHDPDVVWPMVQEFLPAAANGIYSVAGFATEDGRVVVRASRKILQRPRRLGIGLCFEGAEIDDALVEIIRKLCVELGYAGIFEIEFVEHEGQHLLIDFNPRAYSQMAFEVERGLPLPYLHYLTATGNERARETVLERALAWRPNQQGAYTHRLLLDLVSSGQLLTETLGRDKSEHWERWAKTHGSELTDAVRHKGDYGPIVVDALKLAREAVRHPRSFWRSLTR